MPEPTPRFDDLDGVPGAHLGLTWSAAGPADTAEVVALARRCEDADRLRVRVPAVVLERTLAGSSADSVSMVGRDRGGVARACASVRLGPSGREVALRALIDPTWRGRGVGRTVLAWQDRWARHLIGSTRPSTVAVPIAAGLIDRRRLYTAAGFSCRERVEAYERALGAVPPPAPVPGWSIRPVEQLDVECLVDGIAPGQHSFAAVGMGAGELAETAERALSRVAERDGVVHAAVLAHATADEADRPVGWIWGLLAAPGSGEVLGELLGTVLRALRDEGLAGAHLYATAAAAARWREVIVGLGCAPSDVELLYSIESP